MNKLNGVDISKWQGAIDFKELAKTKNFIIVKCGGGDSSKPYIDSYFKSNFEQANKNFSRVGVYWFLGANSYTNCLKEMDIFINTLKEQAKKGYYSTMPIFIDVERKTHTKNKNLKSLVYSLLEYLEQHGFYAGFYTYRSLYDEQLKGMNSRFYTWLADYRKNKITTYSSDICDILQYTANGVSPTGGAIDLNYCFRDVSDVIRKKKFNLIP